MQPDAEVTLCEGATFFLWFGFYSEMLANLSLPEIILNLSVGELD